MTLENELRYQTERGNILITTLRNLARHLFDSGDHEAARLITTNLRSAEDRIRDYRKSISSN